MDLKVIVHIPPMYTTRKRWTLQQELELLRLSKQYNMDWKLVSQSWLLLRYVIYRYVNPFFTNRMLHLLQYVFGTEY